jgi:hypothetical protein
MDERVVMVGAGYWAQFQVEGWRDAGAPLVAIANRHRDAAEALARRYNVPRCYTDVAAMLDAERPTLVDVVLPPVAQEPAVRAAIERGIPTICQKPFGIDLAQAEAMTALAEAAGVPLVIHVRCPLEGALQQFAGDEAVDGGLAQVALRAWRGGRGVGGDCLHGKGPIPVCYEKSYSCYENMQVMRVRNPP